MLEITLYLDCKNYKAENTKIGLVGCYAINHARLSKSAWSLKLEYKSFFDDFLKDVVNIDQGRLDSLDTSISAIQRYLC